MSHQTRSKYATNGHLYGFANHPAESSARMLVEGYFYPPLHHEGHIRPFNKGINRMNREAKASGCKFPKRAVWASLKG